MKIPREAKETYGTDGKEEKNEDGLSAVPRRNESRKTLTSLRRVGIHSSLDRG